MNNLLLLLASVVFSINISYSQQPEAEVKSTIDILFDGMRSNDSLLIKTALHENCTLQTIQRDKDANVTIAKTDIRTFVKNVGTKREGVQLDERLSGYEIMIDGDMAIAWTPYSFFVNNNFSHCGVNAFTLIRDKNSWKIIAITDTRRKTDCK